MKEHGICAKCKKSVGCPYADDRITGCKNFVLEPELKLTNEEWLRTATTEQLAEEISHLVFGGDFKKHISKMGYINMHSFKTEIMEWLKQPHKPFS